MKSTRNGDPGLDAREALPLIQRLSHLHEAVALIDADGDVIWLSDALASLYGGVRSLEGRSWRKLLAREGDAERLVRGLRQGGRFLNEPVLLRGRDGCEVSATISAARLGSQSGPSPTVAILRIEGTSEKVSHEFRLNVGYLSAILDSSPDGVVVMDRSRFITYVNPAMCEMTGWDTSELIDKPLAIFLGTDEDLETIADALRPEGPVRNLELEVRRKDGSKLCVSVSASLLRLPDGTHVGAVAHVRDVTERRRFEQDLASKNAELEHYVDAVSHDLRSPLMSLLGFSRLLREDYQEHLDDKGRHFLKRIEEAAHNMENLIHDLLELSRIGKTDAAPQWVDPREVLQQLKAELKPRLDASSVLLELPPDPPMVRCNRTRLYQVLSNLVGNALDHMGPVANPMVRVEISAVPNRTQRITVADNGRGIEPAHQERIFDLFHSLAPGREANRGTGVGLAIVKKIAETHGGRAWVESEPGRGAAFHVSLASR